MTRKSYGDDRNRVHPRRSAAAGGADTAQLIKQQRRRYADTILRTLIRTQRGQSPAQVERILRQALKSSGVRLSPSSLHHIACEIAAGRPVELA